jgi:hypothetical protein
MLKYIHRRLLFKIEFTSVYVTTNVLTYVTILQQQSDLCCPDDTKLSLQKFSKRIILYNVIFKVGTCYKDSFKYCFTYMNKLC